MFSIRKSTEAPVYSSQSHLPCVSPTGLLEQGDEFLHFSLALNSSLKQRSGCLPNAVLGEVLANALSHICWEKGNLLSCVLFQRLPRPFPGGLSPTRGRRRRVGGSRARGRQRRWPQQRAKASACCNGKMPIRSDKDLLNLGMHEINWLHWKCIFSLTKKAV